MSVDKRGVVKSPSFFETDSNNIFDKTLSYSFTPSADITDSCFNSWYVDFSQYKNTTMDLKFRIQLTVKYSGFDTSSTAGTFALYWQGDNYEWASESGKWAGTNYVTNALNSQQNLTNLVTGTNGEYSYNTTFTIPTSWFETYTKSRLGIRSNFSNGIGNIIVNNVKVYLDKYYGNNVKIAEDYITANTFYEY